MSGMDILKDGNCIVECFGLNLDKLVEGDRIGVMRTSNAELVIYINGESQGENYLYLIDLQIDAIRFYLHRCFSFDRHCRNWDSENGLGGGQFVRQMRSSNHEFGTECSRMRRSGH